jgi:hypothetical protein
VPACIPVLAVQLQGRGSLHAHILLWLDPNDVDEVCKEICCVVPGKYRGANTALCPATADMFEEPQCEALQYLQAQVLQKQQHFCRDVGVRGSCREQGTCRYHFPHGLQPQHEPQYCDKSGTHRYYCPRYCDRNTVPYHPMVLLLWGAHTNVQRVTHSAWSYYLFKYALKVSSLGGPSPVQHV